MTDTTTRADDTTAPAMRDELRAYRDACTTERIDALQALVTAYYANHDTYHTRVEDVGSPMWIATQGGGLLTALRALAEKEATQPCNP